MIDVSSGIINAFLLSALIAFVTTPLMIFVARRFKLVDDPRKRPHPAHTHTGVIPRGGGVPIFLGIFIPLFFLSPLSLQLIGIFIGSLILVVIGVWDDRKSRSPYVRFCTNALAALVAVAAGVTIPYITSPLGGIIPLDTWQIPFPFLPDAAISIWAVLFALVWILWNTNIIGWSGGVDGQLPGFVAISAIVIGMLSLRFATVDTSQLFVTRFSFLIAGAFVGFLPWNFYPQKIMPGYGGKTLAGFLLGIASILAFGKLGTALLVLAIPMTDAVFVFTRRLLSGKSPVWATSGHLHHHLLELGWSRRKIALFYWTVSTVAGVAALTLTSQQKVFVFVLIITFLIGLLMGIHTIRTFPTAKEED